MKNVFITGGAGFIGSHCVVSLVENGYNPIILDNFSNSHKDVIKKLEILINKKIFFYKVDLRDKKKLKLIFKKHQCHSVIHCAGFMAVGESVEKPELYKLNNIGGTEMLLEVMSEFGVHSLVFSSSCTVYGEPENIPVDEYSPFLPSESPYGFPSSSSIPIRVFKLRISGIT